ncbi:MAG: flagellar basal body rod protein FlgB [Steroidobacteraceae bacterium]
MAMSLDSYLGIHPQALKLSAQRSELLAANMANADTPNYKARDIDFKTALVTTGANLGLQLRQTTAGNSKHIALEKMGGGAEAKTMYREPLAPSLDGNTVDSQVEQANFAQNAIHYQASLSFVNGKFRSLMTAITGQ